MVTVSLCERCAFCKRPKVAVTIAIYKYQFKRECTLRLKLELDFTMRNFRQSTCLLSEVKKTEARKQQLLLLFALSSLLQLLSLLLLPLTISIRSPYYSYYYCC